MILVSGCLAGWNCRFKGDNKENEKIVRLIKEGKAIPVCPEQLIGLSTPRKACEGPINGKVFSKDGEDFTEIFTKAAEATLELCKKYNCDKAILKEYSPSCGSNKIFDGTFSGIKIDGAGITAKLLKENGIEVISEEQI